MHRLFSGVLGALLVFTACGQPAPQVTKPIVLTSFSVLADMTHNILGDVATVESIVGPDSDAHAYEPRPADSARLGSAAAVVRIGLGFELWLDDLLVSAESTARIIDASSGVVTHTGHEGHDEVDPHIWHDVQRSIQMVKTISAALREVFPAGAATITANTDRYIAELTALDAELLRMAETIPSEQRVLVTSHDTFGYFAERYGFTVVGTVFGTSTADADPSAQAIAALVDQIKASGTRAIFIENMSNPTLTERIANEADVIVAPPLYTDALGLPSSAGDTYIKMMRSNMTTIVTALRGNG
jgi:ABC-type Zn uptake system ZnuABC Zn-binding protein ZnuA